MTLHNLGVCCQEFIRLYLPNLDMGQWKDLPEKCYTEDSRQSRLPPRKRHAGWINMTSITDIQSDKSDSTEGELSRDG